MPKRSSSPDAARRNFLKGAGLIGAAAAVAPPVANALPATPPTRLKAAVPGPRQIAAETVPPGSDPVNQTTSGGDFMTDVLNSLGIEYLAVNCASSYRGLHEAILNHGFRAIAAGRAFGEGHFDFERLRVPPLSVAGSCLH
jgi:acetolactate synthase I/II/III large subunit